MCTVSLIRPVISGHDNRVPRARLVFNRDERRSRSIAVPPALVAGARTSAVMPVDPDGQGTWLAVNDAGLIFSVLNAHDDDAASPAEPGTDLVSRRSRGSIVPELIDASSIEEVRSRLRRLNPRAFRPFRLLVFGEHLYLNLSARRGTTDVSVTRHLLPRRFMATSSSVRPRDAAAMRAGLFRKLVVSPAGDLQDRFHAYQWPSCPELSVNMTRDESCTVSRTVIERFVDRVVVRYQASQAESTSLTLGLATSTMRLEVA